MDISKVIRDFRRAKGLTQAELAQLTGYTVPSSIAKIESGKIDLPRSKVKLFARVLNIPKELLLEDEPQKESTDLALLPSEVVTAFTAAGFTVSPSFSPLARDFADLAGQDAPPEIYNVVDPKTAKLARFTGDELRGMTPTVLIVTAAFKERCIGSPDELRNTLYKIIDNLPSDKLPILEAFLEGLKNK